MPHPSPPKPASSLADAFAHDLPRVFPGFDAPLLIGIGGRSHVFRVERQSPIHPDQREVAALKVLGLVDNSTASAERYFASEQAALARLRGVIDTTDDPRSLRLTRFHGALTGVWQGRAVFAFVGDFFADGTLTAWRQNRDRVTVADVCRLVRDIADALQFLHDQGEVHQDVKPDNVFVTRTTEGPRARLGDFGCTRPDGMLTESRTPMFAPDIGEPRESGGKYDVFSLGCLVAALINGHLRPDDRRFGRLSAWVLDRAKAAATVIDADARWYRDVMKILLAATQPDFRRRPNATEFAEYFERASTANHRRFLRREKRGGVAVGGRLAVVAVALAAVMGIGIAAWNSREPSPDSPATETPPRAEFVAAGDRLILRGDGALVRAEDGAEIVPALDAEFLADPHANFGVQSVRGGIVRWWGEFVEWYRPAPQAAPQAP